jgi:hypothetical protein
MEKNSPLGEPGWFKVVPQRGLTWAEVEERAVEGEVGRMWGLRFVENERSQNVPITAQEFMTQIERRLPRRLPDDPEWCGHSYVDREAWHCIDCEHPVTEATKARLNAALQETDPQKLWVLLVCDDEDMDNEPSLPEVLAIVWRTSQLPRSLMVAGFMDADDLRRMIARSTWVQNVFVPHGVTGYDPGDGTYVASTFNLVYEPLPAR